MTTQVTKKLQKQMIKLQNEVNELEATKERLKEILDEQRVVNKELNDELELVTKFAAELCNQAILQRNFPTLAKQIIGGDDAVNKYLRYIMGQ